MIIHGIAINDTAMKRRLPRAWPWIKDALAGVGLIIFTVGTFYALDHIVAGLQQLGWLE